MPATRGKHVWMIFAVMACGAGVSINAEGTLSQWILVVPAHGSAALNSQDGSSAAPDPVTIGFEEYAAQDETCQADVCSDPVEGQCGYLCATFPEATSSAGWSCGSSQTQPHVTTQNPYSGMKCLQFGPDPCSEADWMQASLLVPYTGPGDVAPFNLSMAVAFAGSANPALQLELVGGGEVLFKMSFAGGDILVSDEAGAGWIPTGLTYDANDTYQTLGIDLDPCPMCCGLCDGVGPPCLGPEDCVSARCVYPGDSSDDSYCVGCGVVAIEWTGEIGVYEIPIGRSGPVDEIVLSRANVGGYANIDEVLAGGTDVCLPECGNTVLDEGEECDVGSDDACPGLCVLPHTIGPAGEPECTCMSEASVPIPAVSEWGIVVLALALLTGLKVMLRARRTHSVVQRE